MNLLRNVGVWAKMTGYLIWDLGPEKLPLPWHRSARYSLWLSKWIITEGYARLYWKTWFCNWEWSFPWHGQVLPGKTQCWQSWIRATWCDKRRDIRGEKHWKVQSRDIFLLPSLGQWSPGSNKTHSKGPEEGGKIPSFGQFEMSIVNYFERLIQVPSEHHEQKSHSYRIFKEMKSEDKWKKMLKSVRWWPTL